MYKIKVYKNEKLTSKADYDKSVAYFKDNGIDISYEFVDIDINVGVSKYLDRAGYDKHTGKPAIVGYYGIDRQTLEKIPLVKDITMFTWNMDTVKDDVVITSFTTSLQIPFVQIAVNEYSKASTWKKLVHEILHAICVITKARDEMDNTIVDGQIVPFYKNDDPYAPDGNHARTIRNIKESQSTYKYFSEKEIVGLSPALVRILDKARGNAGVPFVITSGYRTVANNKKVGGSPNSAHLRGLAVDLACTDNTKRTAMLKGILSLSEPVFLEIARKHLHVDIDASIHKLGMTIVEDDD